VCLPKDRGGLGVNLSLLAKWRWQLLQEENMLWKQVLNEKCGPQAANVLDVGLVDWP
jgi:hypothetical protein